MVIGIIPEPDNHYNRRLIKYKVVGDCWINISHTIDKDGYGVIKRHGKKQRLHRYIATLYHGEPPTEDAVVMHSCNNKKCINPEHLSWGTVSQNTVDAYEDGLIPRGEEHYKAKLSEEDVVKIKKMLAYTDKTFREIAKIFGVSPTAIRLINEGKNWKHVLPNLKLRKSKTISREEVEFIKELLRTKKYTHKQISEITGVKVHVISDISAGRSYNFKGESTTQ